jgi:hypothetical protein
MNSVKIAEELGTAVWKARNPDAIDRLVVDDFVITTGGVDINEGQMLAAALENGLTHLDCGMAGMFHAKQVSDIEARGFYQLCAVRHA